MSDFPFMEIEYCNTEKEAANIAAINIKKEGVLYCTIEKITKTTKKTIRSYTK